MQTGATQQCAVVMDAAVDRDPAPDVYVICLAKAFDKRGAVAMAFLERELARGAEACRGCTGGEPQHAASSQGRFLELLRRAKVKRFDAVTPADFSVEDAASAAQVAIIRGRAPRVTDADMSRPEQVACYLSHAALWQVCADSGRPIVVAEDDARPSSVASRVATALLIARAVQGRPPEAQDTRAPAAVQEQRQVPLVVLLQHYPFAAMRAAGTSDDYLGGTCAASPQECRDLGALGAQSNRVSSFVGASMYYLTPAAARLLLKHSAPAEMHVDVYMSTAVAAYDVVIYSVPGAGDQRSDDTTLQHSSPWDVVVNRLTMCMSLLAVVAVCLLAWAVTATVIGAACRATRSTDGTRKASRTA